MNKIKCKRRYFIPNVNKELKRFDLLKKFYNHIDKLDLLNAYNYKTTKYDPIFINYNNRFTKKEYKKLIVEIENIHSIENVNKDFKGNIIILSYNEISYNISKTNYSRIKKQLIDKTFLDHGMTFDTLIWCLLNRYSYFNMLSGLMGSILPEKYLTMSHDNNSELFECFGSFLNHTSRYYCGLFSDLEYYFGNVGNFFDTKFKKGLFFVNPPFTVEMINKVCKHLSEICNNKLTFILIIPTWRIEDRNKLNKICKSKLRTDYSTDVNLDPILSSKFFQSRHLYCKEDFPYFDFVDETIRYFASTDVMVLGKLNINISKYFPKPAM